MKNWRGLNESNKRRVFNAAIRSEEGHGELEYDHHSNSELELLTHFGHPDHEEAEDLFTFNNAELYITEPEDKADFDQYEFEVCSCNVQTCVYVHW